MPALRRTVAGPGGRRVAGALLAAAVVIPTLAASAWGDVTGEGCPRFRVSGVIRGPECGRFGNAVILARDLNESRHVIGSWLCPAGHEQPFIWRGDVIEPLPLPPNAIDGRPRRITNDECVVGTVIVPDNGLSRQGFMFDGTTLMLLPTLPGGNYSEATSSNDAGTIVGRWGNNVTGPGLQAFVWRRGRMSDLSGLGAPIVGAEDVNERDQVVGAIGTTLFDLEGYIWDDGAIRLLGPIPGGVTSEPRAVNAWGSIVGAGKVPSDVGGHDFRAFIWRDEIMAELGVLPGFSESWASDINDAHQAVGWCEGSVSEGSTAFLWQDGVMWNLSDLVQHDLGLNPRAAMAINERGDIVVLVGIDAWVLERVPPSIADLDGDCLVGASDLVILVRNWGIGGELADLNEDAVVDIDDLLILLDHWS